MTYVAKVTAFTSFFVSVVPELHILGGKPYREGFTQINNCFTFIYIHISEFTMTPEAEKFNGWAAMLGFVAAFGAYATTGQIIPGIF